MFQGIFMKKSNRIFFCTGAVILLLSIVTLVLFGIFYMTVLSNIDYELDEELFLASKGSNITRFYYNGDDSGKEYVPIEYYTLSNGGSMRSWYSYSEICDNLKDAFVSTEDRRFFTHNGVDIKRTAYALFNHIFHIKKRFGGSTITQQLIKNISGDDEQTATRKISEIARALRIEGSHTKEEIFELYMNIVPMGDGISGVGLASERYFGKAPGELNLAEAATLVGITNAPGKYNPYTHPEKCREKRNTVLYAMYTNGKISESEYLVQKETELGVIEEEEKDSAVWPWFIETVCDDIARDLVRERNMSESAARHLIYNGGINVYTTVSPKIQSVLEDYFENKDNFPDSIDDGLNYSMVISDTKTGNLLGIIGSVGKKQGNRIINNAMTAHTPASALKPLALYAPLIDSGKINWATVFDDTPERFIETDNGEYVAYPKNYPNVYDGLTTVSDALRLSKNTVAVKMYNILGGKSVYKSLKEKFGFDTLVEKERNSSGKILTDISPSPLALGQLTHGISLRKLTEAYTVFGGYGELSRGRSYISVTSDTGEVLLNNERESLRVFSSESAQIMNQMLMRVVESGTARAVTLGELVDTAGKTGTSSGDKDRLFVGFTPYYTAGIWCGYTNNTRPIGAQTITHIDIWNDIMTAVHEEMLSDEENLESFSTDGLEYLPFCKDSGELYSDNCILDVRGERLAWGYFAPDNKPVNPCHRHVLCYYDVEGKGIATDNCPEDNLIPIALLDISERSFPMEIIITDAEYVYRKIYEGTPYGDSEEVPYFVYTLDNGEYIGIGKNKKQFNSACQKHRS